MNIRVLSLYKEHKNLTALWTGGYALEAGVCACADECQLVDTCYEKPILTFTMIQSVSAKLAPALIVLSISMVVQTYNCGELLR